MRHKVASWGIGGSRGDTRNAETGEEARRFLRGNRIVEVSPENAEFRRESMVNPNILFAIVKCIAPDPGNGLVGSISELRKLCKDILDVRGRDWVDVCYRGSRCRAVAAGVV